jgi:hypothetical protein
LEVALAGFPDGQNVGYEEGRRHGWHKGFGLSNGKKGFAILL